MALRLEDLRKFAKQRLFAEKEVVNWDDIHRQIAEMYGISDYKLKMISKALLKYDVIVRDPRVKTGVNVFVSPQTANELMKSEEKQVLQAKAVR